MADAKKLRKGYPLHKRHLATSLKERGDAAALLDLIFELVDEADEIALDDDSDEEDYLEDLESDIDELLAIWEDMVFEKPYTGEAPKAIRLTFNFLDDLNVAQHYRYRSVADLRYTCG